MPDRLQRETWDYDANILFGVNGYNDGSYTVIHLMHMNAKELFFQYMRKGYYLSVMKNVL